MCQKERFAFFVVCVVTTVNFVAGQSTANFGEDCNPDQFQCPDSKICLYREICDGYRDCPGGEDEEQNCSECKEFQFKCVSDGKCIQSYHRCNWAVDCEDGSDEFDCPTPPPMII